MSLFQCDECGCVENTALGWYHGRDSEWFNNEETLGRKLCSVHAPTHFPSGELTGYKGVWHNRFHRTFLPHGTCDTNEEGNMVHLESGTVEPELYLKYGSDTEHPKV